MVETVKGFVVKVANDWAMNLAAMLAYNILSTIFPIVLALITILGIFVGGNHALFTAIQDGLITAMPSSMRSGIDIPAALHNLSKHTGVLGLVSLIGLLIGGTNLFGVMENAFSIIYRTRSRDLIPQKVMSLAMLLLFTVLAPLMIGASTLINLISSGAHALIPVTTIASQLALQGVSLLASASLAFVLFLAIYTIVPNLPLSVRHAWRGALVSSGLLVVVDLLFPLYANLFIGPADNYGAAAGFALVFTAWFWLFSVVLLLGAEINSYAMGMRATEGDLAAEFHHDRVHRQGQDVPPSHAGKTEVPAHQEQRAEELETGTAG